MELPVTSYHSTDMAKYMERILTAPDAWANTLAHTRSEAATEARTHTRREGTSLIYRRGVTLPVANAVYLR